MLLDIEKENLAIEGAIEWIGLIAFDEGTQELLVGEGCTEALLKHLSRSVC